MSTLAVHRIIEEQASTHKDRPAIADANLTLSYHELNREANGLARHLFAHGFGRGALLAVPLRPTLDTAILLLAVLKTGGSYSLLAEDGNLCAWRAVPGALLEREPMALPDLASAPKSASVANLPVLSRGSDVACVVHSADGAAPMIVPHETIAACRRDSIPQLAPWAGDPIGLDLWVGLMSGATVTLAEGLIEPAA